MPATAISGAPWGAKTAPFPAVFQLENVAAADQKEQRNNEYTRMLHRPNDKGGSSPDIVPS